MVDNKKVVKKKRVVRRKKKPMNKKPKKPTTQRQNQKQNVTQKVVVNVVMPKVASRRKKGYNPPKQVKPSMNKFFGEPSHLKRPDSNSNPYDSLFRNINSPHKEPDPNESRSLATSDPNAVRSEHANAMPHTVAEGGASNPSMADVETNETGKLEVDAKDTPVKVEPQESSSGGDKVGKPVGRPLGGRNRRKEEDEKTEPFLRASRKTKGRTKK